MRESLGEDVQQNKKITQLTRCCTWESISNLNFVSSESESGSETESGTESEPGESNIEENDAGDEQQEKTLSDISVGDFDSLKYNYSRSVK